MVVHRSKPERDHLSDVPMKTAADHSIRRSMHTSPQWSTVQPSQVVPLQPTLYITGTGVFSAPPPGIIPPNTLSYGVPPPITAYSTVAAHGFIPQNGVPPNAMPIMMHPPNNAYFQQPPPNFMPQTQPIQVVNVPPMPLSSITPVIPENLQPLNKGRGGKQQKPQK